MYRTTIILFIIFSTLFNTACTLNQKESQVSRVEINSPSINKDKINLEDKQIKYLKVQKNITLEEKINEIVSVVSSECFSNLPIKVKIYGNDTAKIDLLEFNNSENNRVSWSETYLNDSIRSQTIRVLLENILQEGYKGEWIEKVQLYYEGELLSIE